MSSERNAVGTCHRVLDAKGVPVFTVYDELHSQYRPRARGWLLPASRTVSRAVLAVLVLLRLWVAVSSH